MDLVTRQPTYFVFGQSGGTSIVDCGVQGGNVCGRPGRMQVPVLSFAIDLVASDTIFYQRMATPAQMLHEGGCRRCAERSRQLTLHRHVARETAGYLATVSAGRTPADSMRLQYCNLDASFRKTKGGGNAAQATADDRDIRAMFTLEWRVARYNAQGRTVVAVDVVGVTVDRGGRACACADAVGRLSVRHVAGRLASPFRSPAG